jgi:hypothetical protein
MFSFMPSLGKEHGVPIFQSKQNDNKQRQSLLRTNGLLFFTWHGPNRNNAYNNSLPPECVYRAAAWK